MTTTAHGREMGSSAAAERGSAMLMAILVLFLVTLTGMGLCFLGTNEAAMSRRSTHLKQAFYLAEAGEESARTALYLVNGNDPFTDDLVRHAGDNGTFDLNVAALRIVYDQAGIPTSVAGTGDDVPVTGLTRMGTGWFAAFVTNDPDEAGGAASTTDTNDLVMLTSIAVGTDRSSEVVQAIVQRRQILPQLPSATITLLGPLPTFEGGTSNVHEYSGEDCDGRGRPGLIVPVVGTVGTDAEKRAEEGIKEKNGPDYESGQYKEEDTFVDMTDPTNELLSASGFPGLDDVWTDCEKLHALVEELREVADVICGGPTCTFPTTGLSNVLFVDGDLEINPPGGAGTLVVTGELRYDGRASWNGMIYVVGEGHFTHLGAGNGMISGAIVVADIAGPDGIYGNADDCSGGQDGFDSALFDMSGGGNATTRYCSEDILAYGPNPPYPIVNFRQR